MGAPSRSWHLAVLRLSPRILASGWTEDDEVAVREHFARLKKLSAEGRVHLAGRTDEPDGKTFGLVLYRAESREEAEALAAEDPAVLAGVMEFELKPFRFAIGEP